jgi:hypothetical protein
MKVGGLDEVRIDRLPERRDRIGHRSGPHGSFALLDGAFVAAVPLLSRAWGDTGSAAQSRADSAATATTRRFFIWPTL